ncbi:MAG: nucleotidyltransferase family protein [Candidatus Aminicenantes bacterium]|nr:nucleotidyltransferase family protein [Candidatus Aminicenantes bacterium]
MIQAIILAAGESKRMGTPKMLLPFGRGSMIEAVITGALASRADGILVVLGAERRKIRSVVERFNVDTVFNRRYQKGMLSSVQKGFETLPANTRAALVMLGDQPSIPSQTIDRLIEAFNKSGKGIVLPVVHGRRGHPLLIDLKYRAEIIRLDPEVGLRALIHGHPEDILEVDMKDEAVLQDIDTREDYAEAIKKESS